MTTTNERAFKCPSNGCPYVIFMLMARKLLTILVIVTIILSCTILAYRYIQLDKDIRYNDGYTSGRIDGYNAGYSDGKSFAEKYTNCRIASRMSSVEVCDIIGDPDHELWTDPVSGARGVGIKLQIFTGYNYGMVKE